MRTDGLTKETMITSTGDTLRCRFYHARVRFLCRINRRHVSMIEYQRAKKRDQARVRRIPSR